MKTCVRSEDNAADAPKCRTDRKRKNDLILIVAILLILAIAAVALFFLMQEGDTVVVLVDGEVWGEYALGEDQAIEIRTDTGYNLLVIQGGKASVKEASCPDGICSAHRPVNREGESIICLPNRVVVEIRSNDREQPEMIN